MSRLAPGVPPDYYDSIYAVEQSHWWHRAMRRHSAVLLGDRLTRPDRGVLDVGCGTGGFLRFVLDSGNPARVCGVDISSAAVELAATRVPEAELHVCPAWEIPLEPEAFDLIVMNDVLQHLPEDRIADTLAGLRRLAAPDATLFVRTNGAVRLRRERSDWRAYDRRSLIATLERAGFACERATYVNLVPSLWALAHGQSPRAPTERSHGIAVSGPSPILSRVANDLMACEARYLARSPRGIAYGHTLLAVAVAA